MRRIYCALPHSNCPRFPSKIASGENPFERPSSKSRLPEKRPFVDRL